MDYVAYSLFTFTLRGHPFQWCVTLPNKYIHSLHQFVEEIDRYFQHYDVKNLKILELLIVPHESLLQVLDLFRNISFHIPKDELIGNFFMKYFSIFFTYLKIHKS